MTSAKTKAYLQRVRGDLATLHSITKQLTRSVEKEAGLAKLNAESTKLGNTAAWLFAQPIDATTAPLQRDYALASLPLPLDYPAKTRIAQLETALAAAQFLTDKASQGTLRTELALLHRQAGNPEHAETLLLTQLEHVQTPAAEMSAELRGRIFSSLGLLSAQRKSYAEAIAFYLEGQQLFETANAFEALVKIHNQLGLVYKNTARYPEAIRAFEDGIAIARLHKFAGLEAKIRNNTGICFRNQGDTVAAKAAFIAALDIAQILENLPEQFNTLLNLGSIALDEDDNAQAVNHYENALAIAEKIGEPRKIANANGNLAEAAFRADQYEIAKAGWEQDLEIRRQVQDLRGMSIALTGLSRVASVQDQNALALQYLDQAQALAEQIGAPRSIALAHWNKAQVYWKTDKVKAQAEYETCVDILRTHAETALLTAIEAAWAEHS